jgi:tetraacyldisaccharide 4'-kinase
MKLFPYQQLYFSTHEYEAPQPLFPDAVQPDGLNNLEALTGKNILLLTGIASPEQLVHDLSTYSTHLFPMSFGDHHQFKKKDIERINSQFSDLPEPKLIVTTEKDATRLRDNDGLSDAVRQHLYILPIRIKMMLDQTEEFNQKIIGYVYKNSRNSILVKGKNVHKPQDSNCIGNRSRTISFRNN